MSRGIQEKNDFVIALLVINKIDYLADLALQSILRTTDSQVIIGYIHSEDIVDLLHYPNLNFLQLDVQDTNIGSESSQDYQDYENENFFKLVQLKWHLFKSISTNFETEFIIYSDLDVAWIESPEKYLRNVYLSNEIVDICIQDATFKGSTKALCMGFLSFKNNVSSLEIFDTCRLEHAKSLVIDSKTGDDGVVTAYYNNLKDKSAFYLLPQTSFPIGLFSNVYGDRSPFIGLTVNKPYIFHANYLVGAKRKAIMMIYMLRKFDIKVDTPINLRFAILIRNLLVPVKRFFSKHANHI